MSFQHSAKIQCGKCFKMYYISFTATSKKAWIKQALITQKSQVCSDCTKHTTKESTAASRELQIGGLADMYRPIQHKPVIETNWDKLDRHGNPTKLQVTRISKTEKALIECSADNIGVRVADWVWYWQTFWTEYEGSLNTFAPSHVAQTSCVLWRNAYSKEFWQSSRALVPRKDTNGLKRL